MLSSTNGAGSHTMIIAGIIKGCNYRTYLELGIKNGATYNYILPYVELAVAVDIADNGAIPRNHFFHMTTDRFFAQNTRTFDAIFIDACHDYEQVRIDFENALPFLNEGGTIFLHDTDPASKEYLHKDRCSDSYRMNRYLAESGRFRFVTIPIEQCGMSIVRLSGDNRFVKVVGE